MRTNLLRAIIVAGMFATTTVNAQTEPEIPWAVNGGGSKDQHGMCISVDGSGNSFIGGFFSDSATFGSTTLKGIKSNDDDAFVAKLDANGNFLWAIRVASKSSDWVTGLSNDANGNCYVAGTCNAPQKLDRKLVGEIDELNFNPNTDSNEKRKKDPQRSIQSPSCFGSITGKKNDSRTGSPV